VELLEQRALLSASTLSFTGPAYSQNFDGLPNTGADQTPISTFGSPGPYDAISPISGSTTDTGDDPQGLAASCMAGWSIAEYSGQALKDFISSSAPTTGGVYDFGTASGATTRALGLILTSGNSPEIGFTLVNNTGVMLPQVEISFTDEQWSENTGNQELDFYYGTTPTALPLSSSTVDFTQDAKLSWATTRTDSDGAKSVDGTKPKFQQEVSDIISGLNWANGSTLVLMWRELNSGNSAAMAIDNFTFSADAAAPAVSNNVLIVSPGTIATITGSQLSTIASPGGIPNSQITYTVGSTAPAHGTLTDGGTTLTTGSSFAQADIAAGNITYTPDGSGAASDSFTFTVSDGVQTTATQTCTVLTDLSGNEPPVNTVPGSQSVIESTSLGFSAANGNAVSITDPDVGPAPVQVALSVSHGVLTLGGTTGLTITAGANGSAGLTFTGAVADIDNGLNGLTYAPAAGYSGADTLQIVTNDLGGTGAGGPQTATSTVAIAVVAAPLLNEIEANPPGTDDDRYEYVELRGVPGASLNNVYLVVFDGISTNNPGTADLVVNLSPYSLGSNGLLVVKSPSGTGHSLAVGTTLVADSFFTQKHGLKNGTLSFYLFFSTSSFSSGAGYDPNQDGVLGSLPPGSQVLDDVALLDNNKDAKNDVAYGPAVVTEFNNTGTPDAATRFPCNTTPSSSAWYGGELVDTGNVASQIDYDVTRESANEPPGMYLTPGDANVPTPVLTTSPGSLNYTANQGATAIDPGIIVTDAGSSTLASATVTISANYVSGEDVLSFANTASITGSFDSSTGTLSLVGTDTVANYQAALRAICYNDTSDNPSTASRTVSFTANDGASSSPAANRNITVIAANDLAIWSGGGEPDTTWSNAANWGSVAAAANEFLCFSGSTGLSDTNDFAAGTQFDGMMFSAGADAFVLNGDAVNLAGDITNNSANTQTINLPLVLTGGSRALNAASGNLAVAGAISESGGSFGVTINGADTVTLSGADTYSGGTMVSDGVLVAENSAAIPSGSLLSIGPGGSVVLGDPGASEPLALAQTVPGGALQAAVAAAGQAGTETPSLVLGGASVTPAGGNTSSAAASDAVLAAAAAAVPTAAVAPVAVDRVLAIQPVPESNAAASAIVGREFSGWSSVLLPASPVPHSDAAAVDHAGGRPAGDATPRVAVLRTAASGQASDEVLLRIVEARAGNAAARAGNQHPATRFSGLDLPTLDLLAAAATQRQ
jgi:autotransporter-associated beta strand protein